MSTELACYRCGVSLAELTLPIARADECPACSVSLHVCRMCEYFAPEVPKQCTEDDAEEVFEKQRANFCEWYKPSASAFDPAEAAAETRAHGELASLFGEEEFVQPDDGELLGDAEDLFK
jgi:hypothetical protein